MVHAIILALSDVNYNLVSISDMFLFLWRLKLSKIRNKWKLIYPYCKGRIAQLYLYFGPEKYNTRIMIILHFAVRIYIYIYINIL